MTSAMSYERVGFRWIDWVIGAGGCVEGVHHPKRVGFEAPFSRTDPAEQLPIDEGHIVSTSITVDQLSC